MVAYNENGQVDHTTVQMVDPEVYQNFAYKAILSNGQIGYFGDFVPDGINGIWCYLVTKWQVKSINDTTTQIEAEKCFPSWVPIHQIEMIQINC